MKAAASPTSSPSPLTMGDSVERALEETITLLQSAQRLKLLSRAETRNIVQHRRDHEYAVSNRNATRSTFLKYASFERELAKVLSKRAQTRGVTKKKSIYVIGKSAARVNLVYSRAVRRFPADVQLWLHYARHCIQSGSSKAAGKVFAKALAFRGDSEDVWLAAVAFHFDTCGDAKGARSLAQRGLRNLPDSVQLWKEYYRMEVCYLAKLLSRRIAIGITSTPGEKNGVKLREGTADDGDAPDAQTEHQNAKLVPDETNSEQNDEEESEGAISDIEETGNGEGNAEAADKDNVHKNGQEGSKDENLTEQNNQLTQRNTHGLSFWNGGVPITVLVNALKAVTFSPNQLTEVWDITVNTPFVPPALPPAVFKVLSERFPNCSICQLFGARVPWDVALLEYQTQQAARNSSTKKEKDLHERADGDTSEEPAELTNDARKAALCVKDVFTKAELNLDSAVLRVARDFVNSFLSILKKKCAPALNTEDVQSLLLAVQGKAKTDQLQADSEMQESLEGTDPKGWTVETLIKVLSRDNVADIAAGIFEVIKEKVLVPFRSAEQEQALLAWIRKEKDVHRLRELTNTALSLPPVTAQCLQELITAELKMFSEEEQNDRASEAERAATVNHTRALFQQASSLPSLAKDVDLWLQYFDFESNFAKDAQKASMVNWKALKTLGKNKNLFLERQTVRKLTNG